MKKYILLDWPNSQPFLNNKKCIPSEDASVFVPEDLYLKKTKSKRELALSLIDAAEERIRNFIALNVPKNGIKLSKKEVSEQALRLDFYDHFTGDPGRLNVNWIGQGSIKGIDDYGNNIDRCSIYTDLTLDGKVEIARFLICYRNKTRMPA